MYGSSVYGGATYGASSGASGPVVPGATTVRVRIVTPTGQPIANLAGLKWTLFKSAVVGQLGAIAAQGSAGTTDASGYFSADISSAGMYPGDVGYLIITNGDGTITQQPAAMAFCGPVAVS